MRPNFVRTSSEKRPVLCPKSVRNSTEKRPEQKRPKRPKRPIGRFGRISDIEAARASETRSLARAVSQSLTSRSAPDGLRAIARKPSQEGFVACRTSRTQTDLLDRRTGRDTERKQARIACMPRAGAEGLRIGRRRVLRARRDVSKEVGLEPREHEALVDIPDCEPAHVSYVASVTYAHGRRTSAADTPNDTPNHTLEAFPVRAGKPLTLRARTGRAFEQGAEGGISPPPGAGRSRRDGRTNFFAGMTL